MHRFENLPGGLRFTKEVVTTEYATVGSFKAIHCCLRGYRSIEWFKDNRAYPWPGGESHFILYPESANQTIYTLKVRASDAGRYSCQARNDTTILEADITLTILGYPGAK
ncbi:uncharacterized protein LOC122509910 isoform X2 [Leptopilina heterotoma]|nr:uncharacterized protein LOC122509910 isoform X2 [Leptopilina heterotoma]